MFCFHGSFHLAYVFIVNLQLVWFVALAGQYSLLCSKKAFSIAQYLPSPGVSCATREKYFLKPRYLIELSNGCHSSKIATLPCVFKFQVKSSISAAFSVICCYPIPGHHQLFQYPLQYFSEQFLMFFYFNPTPPIKEFYLNFSHIYSLHWIIYSFWHGILHTNVASLKAQGMTVSFLSLPYLRVCLYILLSL